MTTTGQQWIEPTEINLLYAPIHPASDTDRANLFTDDDYRLNFDEPFEDIAKELAALSITLLRLLPDPSLSPNERLERLARVVPGSVMVTAHRRNVRSKLLELRRRLDDLVPEPGFSYADKLNHLVARLDELVPGDDLRPIQKLEKLGDYRSTDIGVSPRKWQ